MPRIELEDGSPILGALKAIRAEAHRLETGHGYPAVSVRSLARDLDLTELLPDILAVCEANGFSNCLDHTVRSPHFLDGHKVAEYPAPNVCYWGPDQLRSRLDCVDWRLSR